MPLTIAVINFAVFTGLLLHGSIGEAAFCFLFASTAVIGLVLHGFGRLQEVDFKNLRLVLREIDDAKKELFVREERLKSVASSLAQIIAFTGASEGRWGDQEFSKAKRMWYAKKVAELASALQFSEEESRGVSKYLSKYAEFDREMNHQGALNTTDPDYKEKKERLEIIAQEILAMIKRDIEQ